MSRSFKSRYFLSGQTKFDFWDSIPLKPSVLDVESDGCLNPAARGSGSVTPRSWSFWTRFFRRKEKDHTTAYLI